MWISNRLCPSRLELTAKQARISKQQCCTEVETRVPQFVTGTGGVRVRMAMFWTAVSWLMHTFRCCFSQLLRQRHPASVMTLRRHGNKECYVRRCGVTCPCCCGSFEADCCGSGKFRPGRDGDLRNPGILAESASQVCLQQREARHWTIVHLPRSSFPLYSTSVLVPTCGKQMRSQSLSGQCLSTSRSPALVSSRAGLQLF